MSSPTIPRGQPLSLTAADGTRLGATRFDPAGPAHGRLVVAGATAVPQGFYRRFAEHAAGRGWRVLTLDYRGIGRSAPPSLKGYRMDLLDWARLDLAAAIDHLADTPGPGADGPLVLVGHSYGGHAVGLLPNHDRIAASYLFGTGAGWHGWMPRLERLRVLAMWHLVGPLSTRLVGYLPWRRLGQGEDLPLDAYRQWKRWCGFPRYFFDDPELPGLAERFAQVRGPIVAASALDDRWAPPVSRDAFVAAYRGSRVTTLDLQPREHGGIGHMGYFRARAWPLWDTAMDWFDGLAGQRPAALAA
jgi:predicted alpha/beta hydrolase